MNKETHGDLLLKGERVLWEGKPQKMKLIEAPFTAGIIIRWVAAICVFLGAFRYWTHTSTIVMETSLRMNVTIFIAIIGIIIAARPFLDIKNLENNFRYIITDRRAIAIRQKGKDKFFTQIRDLSDFTEALVVEGEGGRGSLVIGIATDAVLRKQRKDLSPTQTAGEELDPLSFYSIYAPDDAAKALPAHIKVATKKC